MLITSSTTNLDLQHMEVKASETCKIEGKPQMGNCVCAKLEYTFHSLLYVPGPKTKKQNRSPQNIVLSRLFTEHIVRCMCDINQITPPAATTKHAPSWHLLFLVNRRCDSGMNL
jgi:hypothetical protein